MQLDAKPKRLENSRGTRARRCGILAVCVALLLTVGVITLAVFTDRASHSMQFTTASFNADAYSLTRTAPVGPFCAGESVTATLEEGNSGNDAVCSVIAMKATWNSPDTALSIFGNANAADNAKLTVGGTDVDYAVSADKKSITFNLPEHVLEAGAANKSRDLTLTIPESFKSTGSVSFTFEKVVVGQEGGGFSETYDRTTADPDIKALDYSAKVGWAASSITAQNGKALMGYLTGKNASGKYGIEFELAFGYTSSPMKDFASRTDAKWSHYKGAVDALAFVEGMTSIGDYAFPDFTGVKSVSFPATVKTIGVSAFDASGLTGTVTIPATVKEIRSLAFGNLPNVKTFTFGHGSGDTLTLPDNTAAGKRNTGAFYVSSHVDTTVNSDVEAIQYGYKWHDGYDNRRLVPTLNAQDTWFRTYASGDNYTNSSSYTAKLDEEKLQTVTFADYHMPVVGETSWDASDPSVPGTVTAYLSADKTSLILAGNGYGLVFANKDSSGAFNNLPALKTVSNTGLLDTRNATTMADMFNFDESLANISVSTWNVSKVENMSNMFYFCDSLPSIDLKKNTCTAKDGSGQYTAWNTASLKNTGGMFMDYGGPNHSLTTVDTTGWDTSKLETADYMFMECRGLTTVKGIEGWDVSSLKATNNMFADCQGLQTINVANWNTASLVNTTAMFSNCTALKNIDISKWDMSKATTNSAMFSYCENLTKLTLPKSLTTISACFAQECTRLTTIEFLHDADTALTFPAAGSDSGAFYVSRNLPTDIVGANTNARAYSWAKENRCHILKVPAQSGTLTYNQKAQTPVWDSNYQPDKMTIGKTTSGTNAGTYTASFTPKFGSCWADLTTGTKDVTWKINKAPGSLTLSKTTAEIGVDQTTMTFTVTRAGDGRITVSTSNSSIATASVSGTTVTVTKRGGGTATITVKVAEGTNYLAPADATCKVTCKVEPVLESGYSWYKSSQSRSTITKITIVDEYAPTGSEDESWVAGTGVMAYRKGTEVIIAGCGYGKIYANKNSSYAFFGDAWESNIFKNLAAIEGMELLDTSRVTTMMNMFGSYGYGGCKALTDLDVSHFDTSQVTNMCEMFVGCSKLTSLDVTKFDTSKVTNMGYMFSGCSSLTSLDVTKFNTAKVTNMRNMFAGCRSLTGLDVTHFDTAKVTNMSSMFLYCSSLTSLDVTHFDTSNVTDMRNMFALGYPFSDTEPGGHSDLENLDVSNFDTSKVTNMRNMFWGCSSLTSLDLSNFDTSHVTDMGDSEYFSTGSRYYGNGMFWGCSSLTSLDVSGWNTYNVKSMGAMFRGCKSLTELDLSSWNTSNVSSDQMRGMFGAAYPSATSSPNNFSADLCSGLRKITLGPNFKFKESYSYVPNNGTWYDTTDGTGYSNTALGSVVRTETRTYTLDPPLRVPAQTGTLTYTGSSLTPTWDSNYSSSKMTVSENSGVNAGSYTATFTPKDGYYWIGGTNEPRTATWKIGKAAGSLSLSKTEAEIGVDATTTTFTVNRAGDGVITVSTSNSSIATATVSGTTVTVTKKGGGAATITVKVAEGTNYLAPADATCKVTCKVEPVLAAGNTWYKSSQNQKTITKISIVDEYTPTGSENESWDASAKRDKSVMAYRTGTEIVIAGTGFGKIYANEDSSYAFSHSKYSNQFRELTTIDGMELLDTSRTTDMRSMFYGCEKLTSLDVSKWNTSRVTDMSLMFSSCESLAGLDVSNFDTSKVTNMGNMFFYCSKLTSLDVTKFDTSQVTNMGGMFKMCSGLASLDVSNFNTSNVTNMADMFYKCYKLTSLDVTKFDTAQVTNMGGMFRMCSGLTSLDVSNFNTSNVTNMGGMFSSEHADGSAYGSSKGCANLTSLDVTKFDTSQVTNMHSMFNGCEKLTSLDVTKFDTSKVTNMGSMFAGCKALTNLDLSGFDTSKVTNMGYMFANCHARTSLDLSNFDTAQVNDMEYMFYECAKLTSVDLSSFNTAKVTDMLRMFSGCSGLTSLDVSNFDTSNVTNMYQMFEGCSGLTSLDLSSFDTSKVTSMYMMFAGSHNLATIYASDLWSTAKVSSSGYMFNGCKALSGAMSYSDACVTAAYANYTTGYLTYKAAPAKTAARAMSIMSSGSEISGYSVSE